MRRIRLEAKPVVSKCAASTEVPTDPKPANAPEVRVTSAALTRSSAKPFRAFIAAEAAKRRISNAIYEDLVEHHGYTGSYDAVKRLTRKMRSSNPKVSCRFENRPWTRSASRLREPCNVASSHLASSSLWQP